MDLIKEELNVKNITYTDDLSKYMSIEIKPNFKICGPILGKDIKEFADIISTFTSSDIKDLENGDVKKISIYNNEIEITYEMIDVRISSKEGFNTSHENNNFVVLNTALNDELIEEGVVREFISKVQQLRKTNDYEMMDKINIYYTKNDKFIDSIKNYIEFIKSETLADNLIEKTDIDSIYDINGLEVGIELEKRTNN
jgi:isoleucyl-tRNA synthetase